VGRGELAARLADAWLLVGNDSGVTHLAAAVGCPVLALFGATDPGSWAPRGGNVRVLGDGMSGMEAIRVAEVLASAQEMLSILRAAGGATGIIGPDGLREGS
jgi:heptosyltransferase-3